jgi:hypothetical protein
MTKLGRPKGSKISHKTELFSKRCTPQQKEQLEQLYKVPDNSDDCTGIGKYEASLILDIVNTIQL